MPVWTSFLTYVTVTAITPGPNNLMSMSNGSRKGFRRALPFNFGILAGFSLVSLCCTLFCSLLEAWIPRLQSIMVFVGAAYMLWLAWETFNSSGIIEGEQSDKGGFIRAFMLQFVNPKAFIYCIVSMEAYILPVYGSQPLMLAVFALLLAFFGFLCTLLWSAFGSSFRLLFSGHAKIINTVMALLLVYCAVSLFLN